MSAVVSFFGSAAMLNVACCALSGKTLVVAMGTGGAFTPLEGSTYANGTASAPVAHFTSFTVTFVDGKIVPPAVCADLKTSFKSCGGDIKGSWSYSTYCPPPGSTGGGVDPFDGRCAGYAFTADLEVIADVAIDATTLTTSNASLKGTSHMTVPLKCMNETPDGGTFDSGVNDCKALETAFFSKDGGAPTSTCVDKSQGVCECTGTSAQPIPTSTSTYTISGNTITSTDSKGKVTTQDYCVDGLKATSLQTGVPATEATLFVLTKK